jgi:hypothetical protein
MLLLIYSLYIFRGDPRIMIKHLHEKGFAFLLLIIMACLKFSYFPRDWKIAKIIGLPKPGKGHALPSSYRPISLLSSLSKILERVILRRLKDHADLNNIIPKEQFGFRNNLSTSHQIDRVVSHIKSEYAKNKTSTGLISIDVEKVYDQVWSDRLLYKMKKFKFPLYLIKIVSSFLRDRQFQVIVKDQLSGIKDLIFGLPQGAVISPFLYNLFTSDFPKCPNCSLALFADDTTFYCTSKYANFITSNLQIYATKIHNYMTKWKIGINMDKTQAIFFTKRRKRELPGETIKIFNTDIPWSKEIKFLGVYLDKSLTFKRHIEYVIQKANNVFHILYPMINRRSKLNVRNKLLLYKVVLRPVITYAAPILHGIADIHLKKLQVFQNKIIKIALNLPMQTSTNFVHQAANIDTIKRSWRKSKKILN